MTIAICALSIVLLVTQGVLMYIVVRFIGREREHAAQLQAITDACMDRIQSGTLANYTAHLRDSQPLPQPEPAPEPEKPFDPTIMPDDEYQAALQRSAAGYADRMGMPL